MAGVTIGRAGSRPPSGMGALVVLLLALIAFPLTTAHSIEQPLDRRYTEVVQPFLKHYCLSCHGESKQEAKLDLSGFGSVAVVLKNQGLWDHVLERLEAAEMPPRKAARQPKPVERQAVLDWIRDFREQEARRNDGDPGLVLARRLSNAEFDHTVGI